MRTTLGTAILLAAAVLAAGAGASGAKIRTFGPAPELLLNPEIEMHVSKHIGTLGKTLTVSYSLDLATPCFGAVPCLRNWTIPGGETGHIDGNDTTARVVVDRRSRTAHCKQSGDGPGKAPVTKKCTSRFNLTSTTDKWEILEAQGLNRVGPFVTQDYFAVVGKTERSIQGIVENQEGRPLSGEKVLIAGDESKTLTTDKTGRYNAVVSPGRYEVRLAKSARRARCAGGHKAGKGCRFDLRNRDATANFTLLTEPTEFRAIVTRGSNVKLLAVGETLGYEGRNWDPDGGVITIALDTKQVATYRATAKFAGHLTVPPWANGFCKAKLTARQGEFEKVLEIAGNPVWQVTDALGKPGFPDGRPLKHGYRVCKGDVGARDEPVSVGPRKGKLHSPYDAATLAVPVGSAIRLVGSGGYGLRIDGLEVVISRPFGKRAIVVQGLVGGKQGGSIEAPKGSIGLPRLASELFFGDPLTICGPNNTVELDADISAHPLLEGACLRREGNLHSTQEVVFDDAVVFVKGDVTFERGLRGTGVLFATGNIEIRGGVNLIAFGADRPVAIFADGNLRITG